MKIIVVIMAVLLALVPRGEVHAAGSITDILNALIKNNLLDDAHQNNSRLGQEFCKAFNGSNCSLISNLGQGICKAGGGSNCFLITNIGQGVCKAGGGSNCFLITNTNDGIKKFNENFVDRDWAWDQFYHSAGSLVWACRGIQTGRFAEKSRCAGKPLNDYRWPNK